jgi:quinol monooxygenase YgiN
MEDAMFGSVFRMRPRPGQEAAVLEMGRRWERERMPKAEGFVSYYTFKSQSRPGELIGVVIFESEEQYRRNAEDPDQDRWYREFRALLEDDPEWNDGEVIATESHPAHTD